MLLRKSLRGASRWDTGEEYYYRVHKSTSLSSIQDRDIQVYCPWTRPSSAPPFHLLLNTCKTARWAHICKTLG